MQQTKTKKKFFYGWVIVFCCTLLVAAGTGIFVNCLGIFVKPVCEELGFDRGPFTLYSTIGGFVGMFAMLAYGELYRRYPQHIRKFIALGTVVCCGAFYGGGFGGAMVQATEVKETSPEKLIALEEEMGLDLSRFEIQER